MKGALRFACGFFVCAGFIAQAQLPFKPVEDAPANAQEEQQLIEIFSVARSAAVNVQPGPEAGFQRRQVGGELGHELENFVTNHTGSAWIPGVRLWLGRKARLRSAYAQAMEQYGQAWALTRSSNSEAGRRMAREAGGSLAKLLALTGRLPELEALITEARQSGQSLGGSDWGWALEMRAWARKHPTEAYKCGLYCLDQLGRLTQPGQFRPKEITETESSTNGFTAADLLQVAARVGLQVRAALLTDFAQVPVPCVLHLNSEHFVVVSERRGGFYSVRDTVAYGPRWLTAEEIAREASGCVLVSSVVPPAGAGSLVPLDAAAAAIFRGRCHSPLPSDHEDAPCISDGTTCPTCLPGNNGSGNGQESGEPAGEAKQQPIDCATCMNVSGGMPSWFVSEPFLNLWIVDTPLHYDSTHGPDVTLRLTYNDRHMDGDVSGQKWQGACFGNDGGDGGMWYSSWLSFAELSADEDTVEVMLPAGRWATFSFPSNSNASATHYRHNVWLERVGSAGNYTSLVLHRPDGSGTTYGFRYDGWDPDFRVYYMTEAYEPAGLKTTFTYDTNNPGAFPYLTNVTAADGTSFAVYLDDLVYPPLVTNITSSYGASVAFAHNGYNLLKGITDAAGIESEFNYFDPWWGGTLTNLVTPYGTTYFETARDGNDYGVFDRIVRITNAVGLQEFYGQINIYPNGDWPDFASGQIPTNSPLATLDTTERQERNTFYWNAQQFAPYVNTGLADFTWPALNQARIRHWLAHTYPEYTHFDTLSVEQAPSPDGSTNTQGQLTWYDYAGKDTNATYEVGTQIQPAVIARVMPDGSTWYQYFERLTNGLATKAVEKWQHNGTALFRTNTFAYAANNADMTLHLGPFEEQVSSNVFNAYHQVTTNYDALNQATVYTYDGTTRQLTSIARPTGLITTNVYDGNDRLQSSTDLPINATRSFTWYSDGNLKTVTDERGLTITNYWDGLNRLTGTKHPDGTTITNLFTVGTAYPDSTGGLNILDLTATKNRLGHWTYFGYDAIRRKTAETNANGVVTRNGYCHCGSGVTAITNAWNTPVQMVTTFEYDYQGNRTFIHYPDATVTNWFDPLQRLYLTCDAWGCRGFYFDNLSRLTNTVNAYGTLESIVYDAEDHPLYVTDANGVTITNTYDLLGRLSTRTYPDGGVERHGYSARGLVVYTNQLDKITYYGYDEAMRKTWETNANNEIIRYTNNAAGDLLSLTDGKNQTTKWNYDAYGRVTNKVDQLGVEILRYTYDADSRLASRWSAAKGTTYYTNDAVGNLLYINYPASTDVTFAHDALNRVTNMVDAVGTTAYGYAAGGQLWTEDGPWSSDTVTNTYSYRLRTGLTLAQPTGVWTNAFGYDAAKRLTNVTSPAGAFSYTLGGAGAASPLIKKLSLPNTSYITNTYDSVARLTGTWLKKNDDTTLNSHQYTYNVGNQRTQRTSTLGGTYDYTYDHIGQLTMADQSGGSTDYGYAYDAAWNLNWLTNGGTKAYTVNGLNELTNIPGWTLRYDANGNLTNKWKHSNNLIFTYDDENQLTAVEDEEIWRTEFVYDGQGRLRARMEYYWSDEWVLQEVVRYVYDGRRVIQERDGNNTPTVSYTRGNDLSGSLEGAGGIGGLLARSHGYSGGNWSMHNYYHADGNGNVTYLVNSSQALAARYWYDPYGNTVYSSGSLSAANVYRFSSKEFHSASGLYYYGYRWYAPNLQRWPNRDPIGEVSGINLYSFVQNDPINYQDDDGLQATNPKPKPPKPAPNPCPGFTSQWPGVAGAGGKVAGSMGKAICCTHASQRCVEACEAEYGSASTLPEKESKACMRVCLADCKANALACAGRGGKPGPKPGPSPKPGPAPRAPVPSPQK